MGANLIPRIYFQLTDRFSFNINGPRDKAPSKLSVSARTFKVKFFSFNILKENEAGRGESGLLHKGIRNCLQGRADFETLPNGLGDLVSGLEQSRLLLQCF